MVHVLSLMTVMRVTESALAIRLRREPLELTRVPPVGPRRSDQKVPLEPLFDHIADTMVDAFTRRANDLHGQP